tara:strand:+ start:949 stop:1419 length:471 start_codon:yes stop_codon:yes gene_type:complete
MAQIKKSVVTKVTANGTWETRREPIKTFYKHEIEMENGDVGEYSSIAPEQEKFIVGQEVEYEYSGGDFPKIKPHYQRQDSTIGGGGYNVNVSNEETERIARSVAIKLASEHAIAKPGLKPENVYWLADQFTEYIIKGTKPKFETLGKPAPSDNTPF